MQTTDRPSDTRSIVDSQRMAHAWTSSDGLHLWVYRSPIVKLKHALLKPVMAWIAAHEAYVDEETRVDDPDMMFQCAIYTHYRARGL